jgi:hypothetical protein
MGFPLRTVEIAGAAAALVVLLLLALCICLCVRRRRRRRRADAGGSGAGASTSGKKPGKKDKKSYAQVGGDDGSDGANEVELGALPALLSAELVLKERPYMEPHDFEAAWLGVGTASRRTQLRIFAPLDQIDAKLEAVRVRAVAGGVVGGSRKGYYVAMDETLTHSFLVELVVDTDTMEANVEYRTNAKDLLGRFMDIFEAGLV